METLEEEGIGIKTRKKKPCLPQQRTSGKETGIQESETHRKDTFP